jgi:hypothetical protein
MTAEQRVKSKAAIFYGQKDSEDYWAWDVLVRRDAYIGWAFEEAPATRLVVGD